MQMYPNYRNLFSIYQKEVLQQEETNLKYLFCDNKLLKLWKAPTDVLQDLL